MKKQGEDFLERIDKLREELQLEGKSLEGMKRQISNERRTLFQSDKQTPS